MRRWPWPRARGFLHHTGHCLSASALATQTFDGLSRKSPWLLLVSWFRATFRGATRGEGLRLRYSLVNELVLDSGFLSHGKRLTWLGL